METNNNNIQLAKLDNAKMLDVISKLNLSKTKKDELVSQLVSDDVELIKHAKQKLIDSGVAQNDISNLLAELAQLRQKGLYVTTKIKAKTGSGDIEMQFKGGDTKLIIPVLIIVGIVIIAALVLVFWK